MPACHLAPAPFHTLRMHCIAYVISYSCVNAALAHVPQIDVIVCCMQPVCAALTLHARVRRYFSEAASQLPTILNNVLHNFYATAALSTSPLIITEYGRCACAVPAQLSCSGHTAAVN